MQKNEAVPAILSLGTAVPTYRAAQPAIGRWMATSLKAQPAIGRWLRRIYANSGIDTRHACLPDFLAPPHLSRLAPGQTAANTLTTAERMAIYQRESVKLGQAAGQQAVLDYATAAGCPLASVTESITHLVVVSCTGFFAPGLDIALARRLKLPPGVRRSLIGFMGCAAGFNGLQTAAQIVKGQPEARVLVISVELCSLHIQPGAGRENLLSACLFADGAAACLVGQPTGQQGNIFTLNEFCTHLKPDTADQMVWQIGNHGFTLRLSPRIPAHLAAAAPAAFEKLWPAATSPPRFWAIHPGGKAIIDSLAALFQLQPEQVQASRTVLRRFGNMSSTTIFFVLAELRRRLSRQTPAHNDHNPQQLAGVAMAFGPGLVLEMARLTYRPPASPASHRLELPHQEPASYVELA